MIILRHLNLIAILLLSLLCAFQHHELMSLRKQYQNDMASWEKTTEDAISAMHQWEEASKKWEKNSNGFELIANYCITSLRKQTEQAERESEER